MKWNIELTEKGDVFNHALIIGRNNELIATIHDPIAPVSLTKEEIESNTRLIAAAPSLLLACEESFLFLEDFLLGKIPTEYRMTEMAKTTDSLKQAISKAKGE